MPSSFPYPHDNIFLNYNSPQTVLPLLHFTDPTCEAPETNESNVKKMDHAVKATRVRPWNKLRFENDELECLYQRYTLKLQRFSVTGVVALVVVLCGVMAALSLTYTRAPTLHVSGPFQLPTLNRLLSFLCKQVLRVRLNSIGGRDS